MRCCKRRNRQISTSTCPFEITKFPLPTFLWVNYGKYFNAICLMLWRGSAQGSLVQRELSVKLTEGLTAPPSRLAATHLPLHRGGIGAAQA